MSSFGDFTWIEIWSKIKELFDFEDSVEGQLLSVIDSHILNRGFQHQGQTYTVNYQLGCCLLIGGRGIFFGFHEGILQLNSEQIALLGYLDFNFVVREKSLIRWHRVLKLPTFYIFRGEDGKTLSLRRDYGDKLRWNQSIEDSVSQLRQMKNVDGKKLDHFLFEREQQLICDTLNVINAQENLVAIALCNIIDQGNLLCYRNLV